MAVAQSVNNAAGEDVDHGGPVSDSSSSTDDSGLQDTKVNGKKQSPHGGRAQEWGYDDEDEQLEEELEGDAADDKGGPHATLHSHGPSASAGSVDHPNECMPCTFYCFTKRGCNRGKDCRFCHLTHQSKLQQRREAWKKQQREKRKSIRERARKEALLTKDGTPQNQPQQQPQLQQPSPQGNQSSYARRGQQAAHAALPDATMNEPRQPSVKNIMKERELTLTYRPSQDVLLVVGQEVFLEPSIERMASTFRPKVPLPHGLALDPATGIIHGAPTVAAAKRTIIVEAEVPNMGTTRGSIELEVIDLINRDLAIGHLSEVEPGKFVMIVHQPEDTMQGGKPDFARQRNTRGNACRGGDFRLKGSQAAMMMGPDDGNYMMMRQVATPQVYMQPCL